MKETSHNSVSMPDLAKKPKKKKRGPNHSNSKQKSRWKELSVIEGRGMPLELSKSVEGKRPVSWRARCKIRPLELHTVGEEIELTVSPPPPMADSQEEIRKDSLSFALIQSRVYNLGLLIICLLLFEMCAI